MNPITIEKQILAKAEMTRALQIEGEWHICMTHQMWGTLINRIYYAMYHAAMALLLTNNLAPKSHAGVRILLNSEFVKNGILSKEEVHFFSRVENMREKGDYDCFVEVTEQEIEMILPQAQAFIAHIQTLLTENYIAH